MIITGFMIKKCNFGNFLSRDLNLSLKQAMGDIASMNKSAS